MTTIIVTFKWQLSGHDCTYRRFQKILKNLIWKKKSQKRPPKPIILSFSSSPICSSPFEVWHEMSRRMATSFACRSFRIRDFKSFPLLYKLVRDRGQTNCNYYVTFDPKNKLEVKNWKMEKWHTDEIIAYYVDKGLRILLWPVQVSFDREFENFELF